MIASWIAARFAGLWAKMAIIAAALAAAGVAALRLIAIGRAQERAKQDARNAAADAERRRTDDEIEHVGHADLDQRLDRWMRDDKR